MLLQNANERSQDQPAPGPEAQPRCLSCNAVAERTVLPALRGTRFAVMECERCTLRFLNPVPSWQEIESLYTAAYYQAWGMEKGETQSVAKLKKATFGLRLGELSRFVRPGPILDVGTATGFFLEVARDRGFEPYGVELSEYSGAIARSKFGTDRIHVGTLDTAPFAKGLFRAIAMSDLLEHVPGPLETLARSWSYLESGGVLIIMTPDTSSLTHRCMGRKWTHYKVEHLTYWNPTALHSAAERTGFRIVDLRRAKKIMTLRYFGTQFEAYPHPILTPLVRLANAMLGPVRDWCFQMSMGEMVAILRKD